MNTLNEFELNRIKKFYAQELASKRLQRSKSTRLNNSSTAHNHHHHHSHHQHYQPKRYTRHRHRPCQDPAGLPLAMCRPTTPVVDESSTSTDAVVDLKRYQQALKLKRRPRPCSQAAATAAKLVVPRFGRAIYDFCAKSEGEMSIKRGELVEILELLDGNDWARVEDCQSGLQGLVPLNYLDHNIGCAVAKRDVGSAHATPHHSRPNSRMGGAESHLHTPLAPTSPSGGRDQLLTMSKGEPIALIRRLSGHLYEASNTRQTTGLVWSNDLDIIKQPPPPLAGAPNHPAPNQVRPSKASHLQCRQANSYEAPSAWLDDAGEFTDDDYDEAGGEDEKMVGYLRSICDLEPQFRGKLLLDKEVPTCESSVARRRRARSASSALNEPQETQHVHHVHHHQQGKVFTTERQQQYCTTSRWQRQMSCCRQPGDCDAVAGQQQQQPCNCFSGCGHCRQHETTARGREGRAPPRSSSSPQIAAPTIGGARQSGSHPDSCPLFRARYAYKPKQRDELELVVGDILVVTQKCDDGWFIGSSCTTKQKGTFPGNFVEPI